MGSRPPGFKSRSPRHLAILVVLLLLLPQASASERGPIYIVGNGDLDEEHGVSRGSGTPWDPYVMENLTVRAELGDAVTVIGTTAYLVVRNCTIVAEEGTGIRLVSVAFVTLENVTVLGRAGILIQDSAYVHLHNISVSAEGISLFILDSSRILASGLSLGGGLARISLSRDVLVSGLDNDGKTILDYAENVTIVDAAIPNLIAYHAGTVSVQDSLIGNLSSTSTGILISDSTLEIVDLLDARGVLKATSFRSLRAEGSHLLIGNASVSGLINASWSELSVQDALLLNATLYAEESSLLVSNVSISSALVTASSPREVVLEDSRIGDSEIEVLSCRYLRMENLSVSHTAISMVETTDALLLGLRAESLELSVVRSYNVSLLDLAGSAIVGSRDSTWVYVENASVEGKLALGGSYFWLMNSSVVSHDAALQANVNHFNLTGCYLGSDSTYALLVEGRDVRIADNALVAPKGVVISAYGGVVSGNLISSSLVVNSFDLEIADNVIDARETLYLRGEISFHGNTVIGPPQYLSLSGDIRLTDGTGNYWSWAPHVDEDGDGILDVPFRVSGYEDEAPLADPGPAGTPMRVVHSGLHFQVLGNYTLIWLRPWGVLSRGGRALPGPALLEGWSPDGSFTERSVVLEELPSPLWILTWAAPALGAWLRLLRSWVRGGTSRYRPRGRR